ncbi:MAG: hydroxymethylbilane synthase, partial [Nitrosopumilaceae archaeon]|nr:hydroxymethylbilane synthase [Nitrosopumilaceae archaeon]
EFPELQIEIEIIKTTGDTLLNSPLSEIGGKGVFVKEIEEALLSERVDIAVHSMKDVPSVLPEGLEISAVAKRHDPRDAIVTKNGVSLNKLPKGSKVGTGSLRRASQL